MRLSLVKKKGINDMSDLDNLEFSQKEKQIIWDALYHYQCNIYKFSQRNHFAKDDFVNIYHICVDLMKKLDKHWNIIH